jgi:endonuclease YncB( thermonuclease family)
VVEATEELRFDLVANDPRVVFRQSDALVLEAGLAWHFKKYEMEQTEEDREAYARAEVTAREAGRGLWRDPRPVAP